MAWREPVQTITLLLPVSITVGALRSSSAVATRIWGTEGDLVGSHCSGIKLWAWKMQQALALFLMQNQIDLGRVHGKNLASNGGIIFVEANEKLEGTLCVNVVLNVFESSATAGRDGLKNG